MKKIANEKKVGNWIFYFRRRNFGITLLFFRVSYSWLIFPKKKGLFSIFFFFFFFFFFFSDIYFFGWFHSELHYLLETKQLPSFLTAVPFTL